MGHWPMGRSGMQRLEYESGPARATLETTAEAGVRLVCGVQSRCAVAGAATK
jgi:hypothetical protein